MSGRAAARPSGVDGDTAAAYLVCHPEPGPAAAGARDLSHAMSVFLYQMRGLQL
jgi:hypothetical protein